MTVDERNRLIDRYADGPAEVGRALADFPADRLTARPIAGKWTAAEIIHHLADSESISAIRIRRLIAENLPVIAGYDQDRYAVVLRYNERPIAPSFEQFRAVRDGTTPLLRMITDEQWTRPGWHTEMGAYSPEVWLRVYADHAHGHAEQIRRLRAAL